MGHVAGKLSGKVNKSLSLGFKVGDISVSKQFSSQAIPASVSEKEEECKKDKDKNQQE